MTAPTAAPRAPAAPIQVPRASLLAAMLLSVAAIGAFADWDRSRESAAALDDYAQEQSRLAASVAAELRTRLELSPHDQPSASGAQLLGELSRVARPSESVLLLRAPGSDSLVDAKGQVVLAPRLVRALDEGETTLRLERPEASALGLPERMAIAGLSTTAVRSRGTWGIAFVATASRVRDRERRGQHRLLSAILLAGALVGTFGGLALRLQRHDLRLQKDLALAEVARQRDERLERLNKAATMLTMASGVAHELGTPLGVIVGRAEQLLERVQGDEKAQRAAKAILEQAQNISGVVRGFLDLARGSTPSLQQLAPRAVVSSALALVEHRFNEAGVRLTSAVDTDLPTIACEPRLLEHALVNLLLNACDASARGGCVELTAQRSAAALLLTVVDAGPGISVDDAARVTEPFFTTKQAGKGTGLGLAIVSEIAKSHHGSLALTPAAPHGTRATLQIPFSPGVLDG